MLMDEPFGAVDPIVRERLQNEFLRLQEQLAKTILFVTHDIDEAIKMGDLVAVFRDGGVLAQFGTPDGDPRRARLGLRGPVRRRGPRAQAAVADPGQRPRARARRPRRGSATTRRTPAGASRRDPLPVPAAARRRRPADRLGRRAARLPAAGTLDDGPGRRDVAAAGPPNDAQGRALDAARRRRPGGVVVDRRGAYRGVVTVDADRGVHARDRPRQERVEEPRPRRADARRRDAGRA